MEQKSSKRWFKLIILIVVILLIILIVVSNIPTYIRYDLQTDKIVIESIGVKPDKDKVIITDEEKIREFINLLNNGEDKTELVFKEYNRGLNRILKKPTDEYACILNIKIDFNNDTVIMICSSDGHGYIYKGESKRSIIIHKTVLEYIEEKLLE